MIKPKYLIKHIVSILIICLFCSNIAVAQWKKCTGKYGNLSVIEIIQVDNYLFASTNKGIIKSENGINWDEIVEFPFPINELYNYNKIIFGVFGYNALKVTYSKNSGKTWEMLNTDTLSNFTRNIFSLLYDKGSIFLATGKGIYRTNNWGDDWKLINSKILGNNTKPTQLLKVGKKYFALDVKRKLFVSEDFGRNWKKIDEDPISRNIVNHNNSLYGVKDEKYLIKLNPQYKWEPYINKSFGYVALFKHICCKGVFISSHKNYIFFSDENFIKLPKLPISRDFDLLQAAYITPNYIVVSSMEYGLWYIPYKFNVLFN